MLKNCKFQIKILTYQSHIWLYRSSKARCNMVKDDVLLISTAAK